MKTNVRELEIQDIDYIADYWMNSTPEYLKGMGADHSKLPDRVVFKAMLENRIHLPYPQKKSYVLIWEIDDQPVGHSNVNDIDFGKSASMHLHLWFPMNRKKGAGTELVKKSIPFYFNNLKLETLFCQPYALNPAPNKTLPKIGFEFVKKYTCTPGSINFEQEVNQYKMTRDFFEKNFK